ncbi:hypothetical protein DCC85_05590 [Paenibacillus sp. CAA11]|nr:hypothetical protein DCC85_05590 [Paenibacillus sp. CAA11]
MCTGLGIYHVEQLGAKAALELGEAYFKAMGLEITGACYYQYIVPGDHQGDHDLFDVSLPELREKILTGEATAFRLYNERKGSSPWFASYGYMTDEYGASFYHIDAECEFPLGTVYDRIIDWLKQAGSCHEFIYGIVYEMNNISDAYYYAGGHNLVSLYSYESRMAWKRETPGLYEGQARYKDRMLRMVYPASLVNGQHLKLEIEAMELREWIHKDSGHGVLSKVSEDLWLWEVPMDQLEKLNGILGEAGRLVAWDPKPAKKRTRKLP